MLLVSQDQRRRLPIYQHRTEILYLVETHTTTVLVGETGSGKTTQVGRARNLEFSMPADSTRAQGISLSWPGGDCLHLLAAYRI